MAVETNELAHKLEERLATLTEFGGEILKRWAITAERHAAAVGEFETRLRQLHASGNQLHDETSQRLHALEQIVQQEWDALRQLHEAPVKELVEQAATLTDVCVATAHSAQNGFDRAEARLVSIEAEFQRTTSELTREIQGLMAEVRAIVPSRQHALLADAHAMPSWPLEGVTRLHNQLREAEGAPIKPMLDGAEAAAPPPAHVSRGGRRIAVAAVIAAFVLLAAAGAFIWRMDQDVRASAARADESQRQLQAAADTAARVAAEKQQDASRELASARQLATTAQTMADIMAAPDLVRYALLGRDSLPAATGQVLWSRSRGFVFSASGLPAPPQNSTYQVWLLTRMGPVSGGTFVPDSAGRVTIADAPKSTRPLVGAIVTLEPKSGASAPTGEALLARAPLSGT